MRYLSCSSPYGQGGLGQHFAELVEESRRAALLGGYYALEIREGDEDVGTAISLWPYEPYSRYTPLRFLPAVSSYLRREFYDRRVASRLTDTGTSFLAFAGEALRGFERARALGYRRLELVVPNSHVDNVAALHKRAAEETGFSDTWLSDAQRLKVHREYETADVIYVHSEYVADSMREAGISDDKLVRTYLSPSPRFVPPAARPEDGTFRIVYVGRVDGTKGIPLLMDAFARLPIEDAELTIVGGWSSRAFRTYMEAQLSRDARISHYMGDPLPALQTADVFVHPSYEDGFGYAPAEALSCGVPVIATQDSGIREYIRDGVNGFVIPTGDADAIVDRLLRLAAHPMAATRRLASFHPPEGARQSFTSLS